MVLELAVFVLFLWLLGLTFAILLLWPRVRRLQEGQAAMKTMLEQINVQLHEMARSKEIDALRRDVLAAVDSRMAARPGRGKKTGMEFSGPATINGPAVGGNVGQLRQGE